VRAQPDRVFPHFIGHELPAGVSGLVLSGLVAATMSTLSSDLNSLSAIVIDDYYCKLRPDRSEEALLSVSRRVVAVAGIFGILLAMGMTRIHSMADAALSFVSLVGGGVLGMYLLGLLVPRCRPGALYIGIAAGLAVVCWGYFCGPGKPGLAGLPDFPLHALWIGLVANLVVFSVGLAISVFRPGPLQPLNPEYRDE
jgi:SSS family solute:Na+ symporter